MRNTFLQPFILCLFILLHSCGNKQETKTDSKSEKTVFQTASHWRPEIDVRSDVAIIYGANDRADMSFEERVETWRDRGASRIYDEFLNDKSYKLVVTLIKNIKP